MGPDHQLPIIDKINMSKKRTLPKKSCDHSHPKQRISMIIIRADDHAQHSNKFQIIIELRKLSR